MALKSKEIWIKGALIFFSFALVACSASPAFDGKDSIPVAKP